MLFLLTKVIILIHIDMEIKQAMIVMIGNIFRVSKLISASSDDTGYQNWITV